MQTNCINHLLSHWNHHQRWSKLSYICFIWPKQLIYWMQVQVVCRVKIQVRYHTSLCDRRTHMRRCRSWYLSVWFSTLSARMLTRCIVCLARHVNVSQSYMVTYFMSAVRSVVLAMSGRTLYRVELTVHQVHHNVSVFTVISITGQVDYVNARSASHAFLLAWFY